MVLRHPPLPQRCSNVTLKDVSCNQLSWTWGRGTLRAIGQPPSPRQGARACPELLVVPASRPGVKDAPMPPHCPADQVPFLPSSTKLSGLWLLPSSAASAPTTWASVLESGRPGECPSSIIYYLCDHGQVMQLVLNSIICKMGNYPSYMTIERLNA